MLKKESKLLKKFTEHVWHMSRFHLKFAFFFLTSVLEISEIPAPFYKIPQKTTIIYNYLNTISDS